MTNSSTNTAVAARIAGHDGILDTHRDAVTAYLSAYADRAVATAIDAHIDAANRVAGYRGNTENICYIVIRSFGAEALNRWIAANGRSVSLYSFSDSDADYYVRRVDPAITRLDGDVLTFAWEKPAEWHVGAEVEFLPHDTYQDSTDEDEDNDSDDDD